MTQSGSKRVRRGSEPGLARVRRGSEPGTVTGTVTGTVSQDDKLLQAQEMFHFVVKFPEAF